MAAKYDIIESLHSSIELKLQLSSIFLRNLLMSLHSAHLVHPYGDCGQSLVVSGKVRVSLESLLHITQRWQQVINRFDVQGEHVDWCDELGRDIEDALRQVSVCFFSTIVRLTTLQELLC